MDVTDLTELLLVVTRKGGAVGFPVDVEESVVRATAEKLLMDVDAGVLEMLCDREEGRLVGTVMLRPGAGPVIAHRVELQKLMIHPDLQGGGRGGRMLARAVERARELGYAQLRLSTRGGTPLPAFYERHGWTQVGLFPRALLVAPGDLRDEHWFQYDL
jgi:acetyltransferase